MWNYVGKPTTAYVKFACQQFSFCCSSQWRLNTALFGSQDDSVLFDLKDQPLILRITVDSWTSHCSWATRDLKLILNLHSNLPVKSSLAKQLQSEQNSDNNVLLITYKKHVLTQLCLLDDIFWFGMDCFIKWKLKKDANEDSLLRKSG